MFGISLLGKIFENFEFFRCLNQIDYCRSFNLSQVFINTQVSDIMVDLFSKYKCEYFSVELQLLCQLHQLRLQQHFDQHCHRRRCQALNLY